ncbi:hypothetical protein J4460_05885 [Candidatus Woesearchaeota archaeon]|nr:MAG: hypothetical protein QS99_C0016G0003 [archaeon GW2011_AR4]MBS3130176.1 hypothetical protein [Candidatus Woesearchaeota archaeon]HIH39007.1 hypothetical protein [Candidatus Woesearchaeota archaeon]HIH48782.1 hypothetical protein [Candidatus Woesearchaeota archaeon]HIJ04075.1 hypothetical protein [Candidatus Woesearchaeota archaeon]
MKKIIGMLIILGVVGIVYATTLVVTKDTVCEPEMVLTPVFDTQEHTLVCEGDVLNVSGSTASCYSYQVYDNSTDGYRLEFEQQFDGVDLASKTVSWYTYTRIGERLVASGNQNCYDKSLTVSSSKEDIVIGDDDWVCVSEDQAHCVLVTCQSKFDGAHFGEYTGCGSGSTCRQYTVCEDGTVTVKEKNSNPSFSDWDASFPEVAR